MRLILEISSVADDDTVIHRIVENFPAMLGRGYHNDIIIADPYVGEKHLRIDFDGTQWTLTDLGSVNPTMLNTRPQRSTTVPLASGDVLRLGQTTLRVFSSDHPVEEPVHLQKASPTFMWLTRPRNVWASFATAIAAVMAWSYVAVWSEEIALTLSAAAACAMTMVLIWAALWSVAGRLIRRKSFFLGHIAIASLYLIAAALVWYIGAYVDFFTNENWFGAAVIYAMDTAILTLLVYGGLSLSTLMKKRKRLMAASFFSCGIVAGILTIGLISSERFSPEPPYPARLVPFLSTVVLTVTLDNFMDENRDLFRSDTFDLPRK